MPLLSKRSTGHTHTQTTAEQTTHTTHEYGASNGATALNERGVCYVVGWVRPGGDVVEVDVLGLEIDVTLFSKERVCYVVGWVRPGGDVVEVDLLRLQVDVTLLSRKRVCYE